MKKAINLKLGSLFVLIPIFLLISCSSQNRKAEQKEIQAAIINDSNGDNDDSNGDIPGIII